VIYWGIINEGGTEIVWVVDLRYNESEGIREIGCVVNKL
jgi:hypothetical protein